MRHLNYVVALTVTTDMALWLASTEDTHRVEVPFLAHFYWIANTISYYVTYWRGRDHNTIWQGTSSLAKPHETFWMVLTWYLGVHGANTDTCWRGNHHLRNVNIANAVCYLSLMVWKIDDLGAGSTCVTWLPHVASMIPWSSLSLLGLTRADELAQWIHGVMQSKSHWFDPWG